ncbi:MAG: acetyl-CoA synthase subunit gamma, partial [Deltaproteobacteria bacterium]|nr:acetyl-CoA synthase subunit gamma [Deltaproteobacteria bacterium]
RKELQGEHVWVLVLDTRGVNVWCAAGKKTFSTHEVIHRVKMARLQEIVSHKRLILPQL